MVVAGGTYKFLHTYDYSGKVIGSAVCTREAVLKKGVRSIRTLRWNRGNVMHKCHTTGSTQAYAHIRASLK